MRTPTLLVFASSLILSAAAVAGPSVTANGGSEAAMPVQTVHGNTYQMPCGVMVQYKGDFRTEQGGTLSVRFEKRKLFASLDGRDKVEMVAVGKNTFVTLDDRNLIVFDSKDL